MSVETASGMPKVLEPIDLKITHLLAEHGPKLLRWSIGLIFFWFGALKFPEGLSSAEELATRTIDVLTFGLLDSNLARILLASWECLIGIGLLFGLFLRVTLFLLVMQMAGTVMPFFFFPEELFQVFPFVPTLEGQYIIKNVVIISAAFVIGATVRGGAMVADPKIAALGEQAQSKNAVS